MAISKRIPSYLRRLPSRPVVLVAVDSSAYLEHLAVCNHCKNNISNPCLIGESLILNSRRIFKESGQ